MLEWLNDPQAWIALVTLVALEIVLGVDNLVFISILTTKLPPEQQGAARMIGLGLAMGGRILLLLCLSWLMGLTKPLFSLFAHDVSGRDLIMIAGGLFLLAKATFEIHDKLEGAEGHASAKVEASYAAVLVQIFLIDMVFSLDSVITAIGMADHVSIMVIAVIISIVFMMVFVNTISEFVERHPTVKMLALSFLLMIGFTLVGEGFGLHIPKGYIYFSMAFSVMVELLNLRAKRARHVNEPMPLRKRYAEGG